MQEKPKLFDLSPSPSLWLTSPAHTHMYTHTYSFSLSLSLSLSLISKLLLWSLKPLRTSTLLLDRRFFSPVQLREIPSQTMTGPVSMGKLFSPKRQSQPLDSIFSRCPQLMPGVITVRPQIWLESPLPLQICLWQVRKQCERQLTVCVHVYVNNLTTTYDCLVCTHTGTSNSRPTLASFFWFLFTQVLPKCTQTLPKFYISIQTSRPLLQHCAASVCQLCRLSPDQILNRSYF